MPQMCPMDWLLLMTYFLIIFFLLMIFIYFFLGLNFNYNKNKISKFNYFMKW